MLLICQFRSNWLYVLLVKIMTLVVLEKYFFIWAKFFSFKFIFHVERDNQKDFRGIILLYLFWRTNVVLLLIAKCIHVIYMNVCNTNTIFHNFFDCNNLCYWIHNKVFFSLMHSFPNRDRYSYSNTVHNEYIFYNT